MQCKEVVELGTALIDGQLETSIAARLEGHIRECGDCRESIELERITKQFVYQQLPRVQTPPDVAARIAQHLRRESEVRRTSWLADFMKPKWKPLAALSALAAVLVLYALIPPASHHTHASPKDGNIIHQAFNNFDSILDGSLSPQIASNSPRVVSSFLSSKASFPVAVPAMKECSLMGGVFSEYNKEPLAHVLYRHKKSFIYIYQAKLKCVLSGRTLSLSPEAKAQLEQSGWYFENHSPDCSLIMWIADSTICCAVADMGKDELLAFLQQ